MADLNQGASIEAAPCPFCGGKASRDAYDRGIDIGCKACGYTRHFPGLLQSVPNDKPIAQYRNGLGGITEIPPSEATEFYHADANERAIEAWNRRTPAAAAGAGELPPLPKAARQSAAPDFVVTRDYYTAAQMFDYARAAIAADRAQRDLDEGLLRLTIEQLKARLASADAHIEELDRAQRKQAALQEITDIGQEIEAGACVKTWQERMPEHVRFLGTAASEAPYKDAEIADLRAQLAAKGQGEPVARMERFPEDQAASRALSPLRPAWLRSMPPEGTYLYLAAPASAQPADLKEALVELAATQRKLIDANAEIAALLLLGAQPDQRESAAVPGITIRSKDDANQAIRVCNLLTDIVGDNAKHSLFPTMSALMDAIGIWEESDPELREFFGAAVPSTAAQPVAKDEEVSHLKKIDGEIRRMKRELIATPLIYSTTRFDLAVDIDMLQIERDKIVEQQGQDSANNSAEGERA
jgi:hypothetical protein